MNYSLSLCYLKTTRLALAKLRKSEAITRTELEVLAIHGHYRSHTTFSRLKTLCPSMNIQQLRRAVNRLAEIGYLDGSKIAGHQNARAYRLTIGGKNILDKFEMHCSEVEEQGFLPAILASRLL